MTRGRSLRLFLWRQFSLAQSIIIFSMVVLSLGPTTPRGSSGAFLGVDYGTKMEKNVLFDFTLFFSSASLFPCMISYKFPVNLGSRESAFFCKIYQV